MEDYNKTLVELGLACDHDTFVDVGDEVIRCRKCNWVGKASPDDLRRAKQRLAHEERQQAVKARIAEIMDDLTAAFAKVNLKRDDWMRHLVIEEQYTGDWGYRRSTGNIAVRVQGFDTWRPSNGYSRGGREVVVKSQTYSIALGKRVNAEKVVAKVLEVIDARKRHEEALNQRETGHKRAERLREELAREYGFNRYASCLGTGTDSISFTVSVSTCDDEAVREINGQKLEAFKRVIEKALEVGLIKLEKKES